VATKYSFIYFIQENNEEKSKKESQFFFIFGIKTNKVGLLYDIVQAWKNLNRKRGFRRYIYM
jgi:hypothetical protein